ncbi:MAG TPA: glutamine synthetase III [Clostridiales bacterium]|jgi:glutamine synthetase|nr:glutamine synthetase III [Clostridiales bacterium]HQA06238.1 glutamine synthetase III [Clostridiales bacterium]
MKDIPAIYGSKVFNDSVMRQRLPKDTYKALRRTIKTGVPLDLELANIVASAMKDWAVENGATHFTHWFQPMTGVTAEKHESFISLIGDGKIIMEFSGKELVIGEPDASSFPSGGLRSTFEARGYTAWDPTANPFIKDKTLFIPCFFFSYSGEALDKKTPLIRSIDAINNAALRVLRLFGTKASRVITTVGAEQEYFLVDAKTLEKRPDLKYCGRTLIGAKPPKGQEMDDHYFGSLSGRVAAFMQELDEELWKLGIPAKTKHNEAAPAQFELACTYSDANSANDSNQIIMMMMKDVAKRHGLVCLLHEKPFAGVNGSGKHNNWSLATDTGINLFEPGETPGENAQFLLFLSAVIKAVDEHQDLLRLSAASAGNDLRLGANEAPPAIISMFIGEELQAILDSIENHSKYTSSGREEIRICSSVLPALPKDSTDRNRTSPFAFTGNKFEFRMLGSAFSISGPNIILNTIVADVLTEFAETLEKAEDFEAALNELIADTIRKHKRIIFNGNNYSEEWTKEAERRGLLNLKSTVDALPYFVHPKNIELFKKHGVFSESEIFSRYEILLENYIKTVNIEALTLIEMVNKGVIPSMISYETHVAKAASLMKSIDEGLSVKAEVKLLNKITALGDDIYESLGELESHMSKVGEFEDRLELARFYHENVLTAMKKVREAVDKLEVIMAKDFWAYPDYGQILFGIE